MQPQFICTTVETQRDFLDVNYKITFPKSAMWVFCELAGGVACIVGAAKGVGNYLLPCGIVLLLMGIWGLVWPYARAILGYRKALQTYGGAMQPSTVTFGEKIVNDTPNGILTMPYEAVKNIHFLKNSFVIEDANGVGIIVSKNGFTDASYMDCVNFLCEQCPNLEL